MKFEVIGEVREVELTREEPVLKSARTSAKLTAVAAGASSKASHLFDGQRSTANS